MAITAVFECPNQSIEKYEKLFDFGGPAIANQPNRLHHLCYRNHNGFTIVDVWADEQSFAAFGEVIGPALQRSGIDVKPVVFPVQGIVSQDGRRSH